MNDANYRITLDVHARQAQYNLNAKQGDTARKIIASFTEDGMPYAITSDMTAKMFINKPDGTTIMADCEISGYPDEVSGEGTDNSRATYTFSTQTCAAVGIAECEIRLYGVNNEILCSPRFNIVVDERVVDDYAALSEDEHSMLDGMLTDIQTVIEALGGKEDTANKMDSATFPDSAHDDETYPTTKVLENVRSELLEVITTIAPGSIPQFIGAIVWNLPNGVSYVAGSLKISTTDTLSFGVGKYATVVVEEFATGKYAWLVLCGIGGERKIYIGQTVRSGIRYNVEYSEVESQNNKVNELDDSTMHYPSCQAVKNYVTSLDGIELQSNKSSVVNNSTTQYPSCKAVKDYVAPSANPPTFTPNPLIVDADDCHMKIKHFENMGITFFRGRLIINADIEEVPADTPMLLGTFNEPDVSSSTLSSVIYVVNAAVNVPLTEQSILKNVNLRGYVWKGEGETGAANQLVIVSDHAITFEEFGLGIFIDGYWMAGDEN